MTTPFPFVSGAVLTAAQMNAITTLPINDQTASYTLLVGDVGKRVIMNVASSNTVTVNNNVFATGDTIFIANKGAGTSTITAGAGVTINTSGSLALAQHGGGTLVALSASSFTFFSGAGNLYGVATGGSSSSISVGGKNYTLLSFTSGSSTLTVTKAGLFDVFAIGGGGGGATASGFGAGGGAGGVVEGTVYLTANQTIVVGAGGAIGTNGADSTMFLATSPALKAGVFALGGGGANSKDGGSGGGAQSNLVTFGLSLFNQGSNGAPSTALSSTTGGGGGGATSVGLSNGTGGSGKEVNTFIAGASSVRAVGGSGAPSAAAGGANTGSGGGFAAGGSGVFFVRFEV